MNSPNLSTKEVVFHSKNRKLLYGILYEVPDTKRVFLFSHGKGNNMYIQLTKAKSASWIADGTQPIHNALMSFIRPL